ncbi:MAG: nucleotidyl transferase AbiEii/AbiGii toxin family protein [Bryobacteraceae bacterium]
MMELDGAPHGGARYPVESTMGGRTFVKFHLDVGIGDVVLDPLEQAHMRDWLGFAGIPPPAVPMIQREQQFAEKLHAYTLPRVAAPNSRVRDLVDMALLIQSGTLESSRVVQALQATFDLRATHPVPKTLDPPPEDWNAPFARLAMECRLELSASDAFRVLSEFSDAL